MIIIKLQGGLGNQMFQYGIASILAKKNNTEVLLDISFFEQIEKRPGFTPRKFELAVFNNQYALASVSEVNSFHHLSKTNKVKRKLGLNYPKIYKETSFEFQENLFLIKKPVYLEGYFQTFKYFVRHEDLIRKIFLFPIDKMDEVNKDILNKIKNLNSIAIHVRRGDYVNDEITAQYHGSCSLDYYLEAIKLMASKNKDFTLVFFSDDSDWVKEKFIDLPYSKIVVDNNKEEDSWKDMLLMSSCNHNIIANSSFSWWAAWLNESLEKIVVAPKKWFATSDKNANDLIPSEWIRL